MFVWLNIIKTHKSQKNDDGITSGKFPPSVSLLVALGILKLKETLATIKCSVHRQKRTPSYGEGWDEKWDSTLEVSACLPTLGLLHGNNASMKGFKEQQNPLEGQQLEQETRLAEAHSPTKDPGSGLCWCCVTRQGSQWHEHHLGIWLPSSWSSVEKDNYRHILRFKLLIRSSLLTFFSSCGKMECRLQWLTQSWLNMAQFCIK